MYKSPNPFDFGAESKICITFIISTTMNSDSSPQYSPNKRFKTLTSSPDNNSKGKSKISEDENQNDDESADCCGICLSEAGNGGGGGGGVSRGYIDSCDHYFCFVCIMEWSKVESKCPLCKRRFSAIRRPPKPPVFASERVVRVPVRDQVYCHFGNATTGPPDPYSELKCGVCHSVADENLLLLCDLCDSGAHTYCVGLGMTVPECDWFCQDCALVREENLKSEANTDTDFQVSFCTNEESSSINEQVSISDIVQEPVSDAVPRRRSTSTVVCLLPPPAMTNNINRQGSRRRETIAQHPTKSNARTLQRCHDVQDHIRVLRENWNGFQNGTLRFSSSQGDGSNSRQMSGSCVSGHNPASSCSNQQSTAQCGSSNATNGSGEDEILAWKMLEKAKSIKQGRQKSNVACRATKCPTIKSKALKEANDVRSRYIYPNKQRNGQNGVGNSGLGQSRNYLSHEKDHYKQHSPAFRKQESRNSTLKPDAYGYGGSITPHLPKHQKLASSKCTQTPSNLYNANVRSERLPAEKSLERRACLTSLVGSEPVVSNTGHVEDIPSSSKVNNPKEKRQSVNICVGSKQYYDAKSEIQSLVKLNLKLQTKDEKLEVGEFKEVARLATHSILVACGLEQPKPDYCSFPDSTCSHPSEVWQPQRCSLMPNSCRECFYVFVKDMVNTIMLEKKRMQQKNTVAY